MRTLSLFSLALVACGGPPPKTTTPKAPSLVADIEAAAGARTSGDAVVTFAVFVTRPPKDAARQARAAMRQPPTALAGFVEGAGAPPKLAINTFPADDDLPIRLEVIAQAAKGLGPAITGASHVTFIRGVGPLGPRQGMLRWASVAAAALAADGVVVDLDTLAALDAEAFGVWLRSPDWLAEQVTVDAFKDDAGRVTFHTRGMAKLGLPDVEMGDLDPAKARLAYAAFTKVVDDVRARGSAKPGDSTDDVTFVACLRPPEAYTHECVRVGPEKQ